MNDIFRFMAIKSCILEFCYWNTENWLGSGGISRFFAVGDMKNVPIN